MGEAMRKAMVTPRGMPASKKPMNSGTDEHEQNGVTLITVGTEAQLEQRTLRLASVRWLVLGGIGAVVKLLHITKMDSLLIVWMKFRNGYRNY